MEDKLSQMMWERLRQDNETRLRNAQTLMGQPGVNQGHGYYEMAQRYRHGWGVPTNPGQAINYYENAAKLGHAGACVELTRLYLQGNQLMKINSNLDQAREFAQTGANADPNKYNNIPGYNQAEFIEQANGLLKIVEYSEKNSSRLY